MTSIQITITINEKAVREQTKEWCARNYHTLRRRTTEVYTRYCPDAQMARIHQLLNKEAAAPTCQKTILCECRSRHCPGRILQPRNYVRKVMEA